MATKVLHNLQAQVSVLQLSLTERDREIAALKAQSATDEPLVIQKLAQDASNAWESVQHLEDALAAKEQQISLLEDEVRRLRAAGKPAPKPLPESVRVLPVLAADPKTGKAVCETHGSVSLNVRRQCPACYVAAVKAAAGVKSPDASPAEVKDAVAA